MAEDLYPFQIKSLSIRNFKHLQGNLILIFPKIGLVLYDFVLY